MHYVLSTFGSAGDVFPILGLSLELQRRGHRVTFATNEHYAGLAREYGVPFVPLGTEERFQQVIRNPDLWNPQRGPKLVRSLFYPALHEQYALYAAAQAEGDAVGITTCFGYGALFAQEKLKMPVLTVHLQPAVLWSDYAPPELSGVFGPLWLKRLLFRIGVRWVLDPAMCPQLNVLRKELGLPPLRNIVKVWNSPSGVICLFPEWYAARQLDWPQPLAFADFPLWNRNADVPLAAAVQQFLEAGTPPLVCTPGSTNLHGQSFFAAALHACRELKRRAIFLTEYPEQLPPLPDGILPVRYVPLDKLLPRAAAFLHHGGIGSMSQAMLAGIPQVVMPMAHDQFDNARRVERLGVGKSLPATRFTGPRLTKVLQSLLDQPAVTAACRTVSERLQPRNGLSLAADAIEARVAEMR